MKGASRSALVAILFCSALLFLSSPLAFSQTPPFRQCPHIGVANSCGVLIVINANNTVSIYTDSATPPYENSDDTLTGIQNNSSKTIASIPLTSTTNIFGFDGDGICDSSITPQPAGCPFGSTGYEGPGVAFSNISSDSTSGTVNFNPGIPPGGSAYFGLEEALTASQITVPLNTTCPVNTATAGVSYSSQLAGTGGNGIYTWSLAGGSLSPLAVSSSGLVSGTPAAAGTLNFTLRITDGTGASATQQCSIAVSGQQSGGGVPSLVIAPLLTKVVPGQTCQVTPPAASTSFLSTDAVIQIWFELSGVNNGDTGLISWTNPSGSAQPELNISYQPLIGISPGTNYVFCAYIVPDASMQSGQWTVNVHWNNHPSALISLPFTFTNVSGSGGSGLTCSAAANCTVQGTANIFGSGHPSDQTPAPAGGGGGTAAPVFTFTAGAGQAITFTSITGAVSPCSGCNPPLDGGSGGANINGYKGITGYKGAKQFPLVGVFLDNTEPAEPAPATLDFNTLGSTFTTLSPALRQVFYIGDGQTNGAPRQYVVPATATRMYLGFADGYAFVGNPGYYNDNTGSLTIIFSLGATSSGGGGGTCGPTANNLIGNGSFELPGGGTAFNVTGTSIPCWTITGGNVDYISSGFWQASDGSFSLDMDGGTPGTIVQSFATTSGTAYTVSFDLAGNPGGAQPKQLQVSAAGRSQNYSFNSGTTSGTNMGWARGQIFTFTANSSTTTLQFASLSASGSATGPALDHVCVTSGTTPCSSSGGGGTGGGGAPPTLTGSNCSPSVSPHDIADASGNGISPPQNGFIFVGANCQWSAYSPVSWATVTPAYPDTQSGNGAWTYALQPNNAPGATPRSTTLTVASVQVTVEQGAASAGLCVFSLDSTSNTSNNASPSPYTGASGSFNVTVAGNSLCSFTVTTPTDPTKKWVQLASSNFSGNGKFTVNYTVAQNNTTSARNLSLTIAGYAQSNPSSTATYTVYQAAGPANTAPAPVITGISNAASYIPSSLGAGAIAQGSFFSIFGTDLGPPNPGATAQSFPLATTLAGVSVTVTGSGRSVPAIPQFVAQFQINAIMPSNAPTGTVQVTVTFNGLSSAPSTTSVVVNNFGAFAVAGGRGPGIVQNFVLATRQTPLNTASVTAARGDTVILWGTGLGPLPNGAADNQPYPPPGQTVQSLPVSVQVFVGTVAVQPSYSGRAPQFPGVDQINFVVPPNAPQGCYVPVQVLVAGANYSNVVTMAIDVNRGTCSDTNPLGSLSRAGGKNGAISLLRINLTDATTPSNNGQADIGLAVFQKDSPGGALGFDLFSSLPPLNACTYYNNLNFLNGLAGGQVPSRGSTSLNAGSAITAIGPNGSRTLPYATSDTPTSPYLGLLGAGGGFSSYISSQPFLSPGSYTISGPGGTDVGPFSLNLNLTASIATNLSQISVIDRTKGLALNWTGGDPSTQAVLILGASNDVFTNVSGGFACLVPLGSSSFTVPPGMMANLPATAGTSSGEVQSSLIVLAVPLGNTLVKFNTSAPPSLDNGLAFYLVGEMRNDVTFQ